MIQNDSTYAVESVTSGHPDKVCDQISDALLDAYLTQDPLSRVAVETFGGHGLLVIAGEVTSNANIDATAIARKVYADIGYKDELEIIERIVRQSPDIALGVDTDGAGDQGIMYGFASNETEEFLPRGNVLVHKLTKGLEDLRTSGELHWLRPDGKAQVTMSGDRVVNVLVSTQHDETISQEEIQKELIEKLITPIIGALDGIDVFINPTGRFVEGGFAADTGLTGRKLMVDTYGGLYPHGGGAFSGKDATKVDRSAAYMARYVAKNLVAQGHANQAFVSVAYAIGRAEPVMVSARDEEGNDITYLLSNYDFRPKEIIKRLGLRRPIFQQTASYGHFGKANLPWEQIHE
jgi:S-adenosylmethionine synthetase